MAGGNQQAGIPQNLTAGRAQGYGGYPGMGAGMTMGAPYANSGLGRFGSIGTYNPVPYTPRVYQPGLLTIPNRGAYVPPASPAPNGGLLGPDGGGPGVGGTGVGDGTGNTGTGIGTPGPNGADSGVTSTPGGTTQGAAATVGGLGAVAGLGVPGGLLGLVMQSIANNSSPNVPANAGAAEGATIGPGLDANTNVSSVNAVNGLDAASDNASVGIGGSAANSVGDAAATGTASGATGEGSGGGPPGDGGGGGGGSK